MPLQCTKFFAKCFFNILFVLLFRQRYVLPVWFSMRLLDNLFRIIQALPLILIGAEKTPEALTLKFTFVD